MHVTMVMSPPHRLILVTKPDDLVSSFVFRHLAVVFFFNIGRIMLVASQFTIIL
jgi:hypothetical protein